MNNTKNPYNNTTSSTSGAPNPQDSTPSSAKKAPQSSTGYKAAKGYQASTAPKQQGAAQKSDPYQNNNAVINQRQAEIHALRLMAERLQKSQKNLDDIETILKDVRDNQRIWTFFQTSLYSSSNTVTEPLRSNLLSLCAFIDKRTFEIYARPNSDFDPSLLDSLIEINLEISAGLEEIDKAARAAATTEEDKEKRKKIITETAKPTTV